jgi:hypothetical protein
MLHRTAEGDCTKMKVRLWYWLRNLPWHLSEVFICDLFGHKPALDLQFILNLTICERCMAPLKKQSDGSWSSQLAIFDIKSEVFVTSQDYWCEVCMEIRKPSKVKVPNGC